MRCASSVRIVGPVVVLAWLALAGNGLCGPKVETARLVVDDTQGQLSAPELEKFAADAEAALGRAAGYWSVSDRKGAKILLELHREHEGRAFAVFQVESAKENPRAVVRVHGVKPPKEMVHKLTHALFPTNDKLIRNMMGIPTEARFGDLRSFPMCGHDVDAWSVAIRRAGSYVPLSELGEAHEDWGMTFRGQTPTVSDRKRQHASYAEAGSLGTFLLNRYGPDKVKAFHRASKEGHRPWTKVFGVELPALEAQWLTSLETSGRLGAERIDVLERLWKNNPRTACDKAEALALPPVSRSTAPR